ncbi:hypothetical protein ACWCRF_13940 [Streptomyces sp. NPDC002405]
MVLAGSTAAGRATTSSDLDIAVLVGDGGETCRETLRFEDALRSSSSTPVPVSGNSSPQTSPRVVVCCRACMPPAWSWSTSVERPGVPGPRPRPSFPD